MDIQKNRNAATPTPTNGMFVHLYLQPQWILVKGQHLPRSKNVRKPGTTFSISSDRRSLAVSLSRPYSSQENQISVATDVP